MLGVGCSVHGVMQGARCTEQCGMLGARVLHVPFFSPSFLPSDTLPSPPVSLAPLWEPSITPTSLYRTAVWRAGLGTLLVRRHPRAGAVRPSIQAPGAELGGWGSPPLLGRVAACVAVAWASECLVRGCTHGSRSALASTFGTKGVGQQLRSGWPWGAGALAGTLQTGS